jgi:ABC-type antimicrobial peptide transport system permease subunit
MVSLQVLRYVAGGLAMGICGAIAAAGALRSQLYEISPFDPAAYVAVVAVLVAVALAAAAGPALRASRVDPSKALRT